MTYEEFIDEWRNPEEFITANTSGSTGQPKIIRLSKEFVSASAKRTNNYFSINRRSRLHSCISPDFIGGKLMAVRTEISGAELSWETPSNEPLKHFSPDDIIDLLAVVPSQVPFILDNIRVMPQIKAMIIGGAPLPAKLRKRIIDCRLNAYETYGMTETASHIALKKIDNQNGNFISFPDISVSNDKRGCLKIQFNSGEEFVTNDLAEIISEKEFLIKGRIDNVINTGGKKISAEELESKISGLLDKHYMIKGEPDEKWGEKIVLMIEDKGSTISEGELLLKMRELLESWQIPKDIIIVEELPRTPNGKLQR